MDKIVSANGEDNKKISDIIGLLSVALPNDDLGKKLRKYLGNPLIQVPVCCLQCS